MKKALIFAPFWNKTGHVGNYRVDRFVRWLAGEGVYIVLVRGGSVTRQREMSWGEELTVRDPLGIYRDVSIDPTAENITRKHSSLTRFMAYLLFNPDPGIIWAKRAARHPMVIDSGNGAHWIISSNPPESAHVGAAILAKRLNSRLIVDMRDGWLDDPLKPLLRISRLHRWREGRLERSVLQQADKIFVTSPVWKALLEARLTFSRGKVSVLTNAYPPEALLNLKKKGRHSANNPLRLVHAGRFTGSMMTRKVSFLLMPLLSGIEKTPSSGIITLLGKLERADLAEIKDWQPRFAARGWSVEVKPAVPREEMMALLDQSDGLLLVAEKQAAIPAKLYEYLVTRKPVFAVTPKGSAVWSIGESLPQLFVTDHTRPDKDVTCAFLAACSRTEINYDVPPQFSEKVLSRAFLREVL